MYNNIIVLQNQNKVINFIFCCMSISLISVMIEEFVILSLFIYFLVYKLTRQWFKFLLMLVLYCLRYAIYCSEELNNMDKIVITGFIAGVCFCFAYNYYKELHKTPSIELPLPPQNLNLTELDDKYFCKLVQNYGLNLFPWLDYQPIFQEQHLDFQQQGFNAYIGLNFLNNTLRSIENIGILPNTFYHKINNSVIDTIAHVYMGGRPSNNPVISLAYLGYCSVKHPEMYISFIGGLRILEYILWSDVLNMLLFLPPEGFLLQERAFLAFSADNFVIATP